MTSRSDLWRPSSGRRNTTLCNLAKLPTWIWAAATTAILTWTAHISDNPFIPATGFPPHPLGEQIERESPKMHTYTAYGQMVHMTPALIAHEIAFSKPREKAFRRRRLMHERNNPGVKLATGHPCEDIRAPLSSIKTIRTHVHKHSGSVYLRRRVLVTMMVMATEGAHIHVGWRQNTTGHDDDDDVG